MLGFDLLESLVSDVTILNTYLLTSQQYLMEKGWEELWQGD